MERIQKEKLSRIRSYCRKHGYSGMILARRDNFRWITTGGNCQVIIPKDEGAAVVVITEDQVYLAAQVMDGRRVMDEEMTFLTAEYVPLHWYDRSPLEQAVLLAGPHPVGDVPGPGITFSLEDIYDLHFPLLPEEVAILESVGAASDEILTKVAKELRPEMTEYDVRAMLLYEYARRNMQCDVLLIGTDERIFRYKHPAPTGRMLGSYVLLHSAAALGGLHANVTRSVYFGDVLPENIREAYEAVCLVEAHCLSRSVPGSRWSGILAEQKALLEQLGYPEDWRAHYPGGRTGYFVCQAGLSLDTDRPLEKNEAYDWFITVTGAKVEELAINDGEIRLLSQVGHWPSKPYSANGKTFHLPQIMMR